MAAYVPTVEAAGLLHVSGQLPFADGAVMTGRLGEDRDLARAPGGAAFVHLDEIGEWLSDHYPTIAPAVERRIHNVIARIA